MDDYRPLDISKWCNAGTSELDDGDDVVTGRASFRGIPFLVGADGHGAGANCYIGLGGQDGSVSIPVGEPANTVVFAHRLLDGASAQQEELAKQVAEYVFHLSGGRTERVAVRKRFEISAKPIEGVGFRSPTYLAVTDVKPRLLGRYEGRWDMLGRRQTEALAAELRSYYLWAWKNPAPDLAIESVEIVPNGPRFIVAGITLGHVDEHPFNRQGRRNARVVLTDKAEAEKPFELDVSVDRGDVTYTHPLPESVDGDSIVGWGQEQNKKTSPSYVEVSAVPSATVTVSDGDGEVGSVSWGEVEGKGAAETPRMRVELIDPGKNWVHVTVLDEDTGKPVPCRVHFRSPEGIPYQPHGHHNQANSNLDSWHVDVGGDLRMGQTTYAYIDGKCQGWLPRGEVIAEVARGFEYEPLRTKVSIAPGQRELTLRIKRWTNMAAQRWYSGDSHVHFLSTQGSHTEALGEDLNVVNLLQSQWGSLFTNTEEFTGEPSVSRTGDSIVYTSQENRQHVLGHMILWGLKEPVMPWCSDGLSEAEIGGTMETTLSYWADEAHGQGGFVINPHFPSPNGEPAALVATGRLDGIEMIRMDEFNHGEYYRYLNGGYRLPLVGGTDKMSGDVPVGLYRTYTKLADDEEFNYQNWCKNVARGRTFLSGGPIISFTVDGQEVGDTLSLSGPGTVEVAASAESTIPINRLEIVQAGRVVASTESATGTRRLELKEMLKVDGHTWLAARCGGPGYFGSTHLDAWRRGIFAHTSPVYVACGGDWWMFDEATAKYMLTLIEGDLEYIENSSGQHMHGNVTHHHGEDDHMAYLRRPFLEAQAAIHGRARDAGVSL